MKLRPGPSTHLSPVTSSSSSLRCHPRRQEEHHREQLKHLKQLARQEHGHRRCIDPSKARSLVIVPLVMLGVLYFALPVCAFDQASIRFENNGYTGITVAFSPDIQYSQRETLLLELQNMFKKASEMLYLATDGKAHFKQVNFLIPQSWPPWSSPSLKSLPFKKTHTMNVNDGHFIVKNPEAAFIDNPMTIQLAGCGKPGLQIQLSTKFMTDPSLGMEERSKILLSNWAKYRYGVFDEHGFIGDAMYPLYWRTPGSPPEFEPEKVTSCAATSRDSGPLETIRTVNQTSSGDVCTLKNHQTTGLPDERNECIPFPETTANGNVVSSLLSHPTLPRNQYFCNENNHNDKAPNKQNIVCEGLSISQVVNRHPDFSMQQPDSHVRRPAMASDVSPNSAVHTPEFRLLQEDDVRIALVVDVEAKSNRKKAIVKALSRYTSSLAPQSEIAVLDLKDSRDMHRSGPSPRPTWARKDDLNLVGVWGKNTATPICLKCVVDSLEKTFATDDDSSHLVLVTEGKLTDSLPDLDSVAASINRRNMPLKIAIFPYNQDDERAGDYNGIKHLMSKVKGSTIHLISTSQLNSHSYSLDSIYPVSSSFSSARNSPLSSETSDSVSTMYSKLCDFFDSIPAARQHMLISRQIFPPSHAHEERDLEFAFNVDSSLIAPNMDLVAQFLSSSQSEEFDGPNYRLEAPFGSDSYETKSKEFAVSTYSTPSFEVSLNSAKAGKWTLKHTRQNANSSFVGVAYARISGRRRHPIGAKCILSHSPEETIPPVLYVLLTQDHSQLVQNALVTVTLTDDLGEPILGAQNLPLHDDGLATPDITSGDGIYSRYLTETSRGGFFGVQVKVRSKVNSTSLHHGSTDVRGVECCGSSVPKPSRPLKQVLDLERTVDCGFILVKDFNGEAFTERITDLHIASVDTINRKVTVTWTAPGLSFDRMELKFFRSDDYAIIRRNFDSYGTFVMQSNNRVARNHGEREKFTHSFNVTDAAEGIYYVAIRVHTSVGRTFISNLSPFYMTSDPASITPPADELGDVYTTPSTGLKKLDTWFLWIICLATVMAAVMMIVCIICCCSTRKRKSPNGKESHLGSNPSNNSAKHKAATAGGGGYSNGNGALHSSLTIQTTMGSSDDLTHEKATPNNQTLHGHVIHSHLNNQKNLSTHDLRNNESQSQGFGLPVDPGNTISPIQYWSAGVLLGHYHDVKQARERNEPPPVMKIEKVMPDANVTIGNSGSSSTGSDNPSGESGSYDESGFHGLTPAHPGDAWRYELAQPAVAQYYSHFTYPQPLYTHHHQQHQQEQVASVVAPNATTATAYYDPNSPSNINAMSMWQESPYPISMPARSDTPSDSGDGHRYTVPGQRRSTTVSQV